MAALAVDARRLGSFIPECPVLPCSLQGKNSLSLLTEEVRRINTVFSRKQASALTLLASMPRIQIVAKKDNVIKFRKEDTHFARMLPDQVYAHITSDEVIGIDQQDEVEEVKPQPQQVPKQSKRAAKRKLKTEQRALKKASRRKEDRPVMAELDPELEPVVIKVAERKAEPTLYDSRVLTPRVLNHYLTRISEGKMQAARMFLRDCAGLNAKATLAEYDERVKHMNAFVAENIESIKQASHALQAEYTGEASEYVERYADNRPVTLTRSHRVTNWIKRDGKLHRKGKKTVQYIQTIPNGLYQWLELNCPMTKTQQRPVAVMLGSSGKTKPVILHYREAIHMGSVRVGTRLVTECTTVPVSDYKDDRIAALGRAYHSSMECGAPVVDLPALPSVFKAAVREAANDVPWFEDEKPVAEDAYLNQDVYLARRLERVEESIVEMYRPMITDEAYKARRLERVEESIIESECLYYAGIIGFNDGVLAGTQQPAAERNVMLTQDLIDQQHEQDEIERLKIELKDYADEYNKYINPKVVATSVDKIMQMVEENDAVRQWKFMRCNNVGSLYRFYRSNSHLVAEASRWNANRKAETQAMKKAAVRDARMKSRTSDVRLYERHWQGLLAETRPETVRESLVRMDMATTSINWWGDQIHNIKGPGKVIYADLTVIGRSYVRKMKRLAVVDASLARRAHRAREDELRVLAAKRKTNPYMVPPKSSGNRVCGVGLQVTPPVPADIPLQPVGEERIIRDIYESVGSTSAWATSANNVLKGKVVDLSAVRKLMEQFKEGSGGILVPQY